MRAHIKRMVLKGDGIPVCPEVMGGLTTPRENSEIESGDGYSVLSGKARVRSDSGIDLTAQYLRGADAVLATARYYKIRKAVLKSKSPACGIGEIYDGTFRKRLKPGNGVLAALLLQNGFQLEKI